ncbi:MAG: hypothetical protein WAN23_08080, partial [Candidatus Acidiferrales bacterium]
GTLEVQSDVDRASLSHLSCADQALEYKKPEEKRPRAEHGMRVRGGASLLTLFGERSNYRNAVDAKRVPAWLCV